MTEVDTGLLGPSYPELEETRACNVPNKCAVHFPAHNRVEKEEEGGPAKRVEDEVEKRGARVGSYDLFPIKSTRPKSVICDEQQCCALSRETENKEEKEGPANLV